MALSMCDRCESIEASLLEAMLRADAAEARAREAESKLAQVLEAHRACERLVKFAVEADQA